MGPKKTAPDWQRVWRSMQMLGVNTRPVKMNDESVCFGVDSDNCWRSEIECGERPAPFSGAERVTEWRGNQDGGEPVETAEKMALTTRHHTIKDRRL